jgi:hypothetical protein
MAELFLGADENSDGDADDGASSTSETIVLPGQEHRDRRNKIPPAPPQQTAPQTAPAQTQTENWTEPDAMRQYGVTRAWYKEDTVFYLTRTEFATASTRGCVSHNILKGIARLNPDLAGIIMFLQVTPPNPFHGAPPHADSPADDDILELIPVAVQCTRCTWLTSMRMMDDTTTTDLTKLAISFLRHPEDFSKDAYTYPCEQCEHERRKAMNAPWLAAWEERRRQILSEPDGEKRLHELYATPKAPPPEWRGATSHPSTARSRARAESHGAGPATAIMPPGASIAGRVIEI